MSTGHQSRGVREPLSNYNLAVKRVLLLGYFGAENLGDDGLLVDWLLLHHDRLQGRGVLCRHHCQWRRPLDGVR